MPNPSSYTPRSLTRVTPKAPTYGGYTGMAWLKFYGLIAGLWFAVVWSQIHYLSLFDDIESKPAGDQFFVLMFSGLPLLFIVPVLLLFGWWLSGALVRYARWQLVQPTLWRCFWMLILLFYSYVVLDPTDSIHPQMSRKGLAPMVNVMQLIDKWPELAHNHTLWPPPLFQFQWGYFLLWFLLWFLIIVLHWSYFLDFWREVWFYAQRFQRYSVSILTGFRETDRLSRKAPVTRDYPRERPNLPPVYRGVPRLNVSRLTPDEAQAILAADASGALCLAPRQDSVLFVDLGSYDFSPVLAELKRADGTPLLRFTDYWPLPETGRAELVIPLADNKSGTQQPSAVRGPQSAEPGGTVQDNASALAAKNQALEASQAPQQDEVTQVELTDADRGPRTADGSDASAAPTSPTGGSA